jgi:hypothetical protein
MVSNEADKDACVCCETPKPGSTAKKISAFDNPNKPVSGFSMGTGGGFKFGSSVR